MYVVGKIFSKRIRLHAYQSSENSVLQGSHLYLENIGSHVFFLFFFRVEEFHSGTETNTVLYIPVGPDCPNNRAYIEKAKKCFLDGEFPPDFKMPTKQDERNFQDRATLDDLNEDAKIMMGFEYKQIQCFDMSIWCH